MSSSQQVARGPDDDVLSLNLPRLGPVLADLGIGADMVVVSATTAVPQVRLTFTSAEVGNTLATDSDTLANQDGGLAVRLQAEDGADDGTGAVSRFDDEGITFTSDGSFTFDVRDLVSGVARGDVFDTVTLGTSGADVFDERGSDEAYYINGGAGADLLIGGLRADFLVGGAGNDRMSGREGADTFIGGVGDDTIFGGTGIDTAIFNVATDGADTVDLGTGYDVVNVVTAGTVVAPAQVRLTFTSSEVGNGSAVDGSATTPQDGLLAVRLQAEDDGADTLTGTVSRFDDEGVRFIAAAGTTFDVRDISGTARGDDFDVALLGTVSSDFINRIAEDRNYYINAGASNDRVFGGRGADLLVGGAGNDRLDGGRGADQLLGGAGGDVFVFKDTSGASDSILDFATSVDRIDLRTLTGVAFADITAVTADGNTTLAVNSDDDADVEFTITLVGVTAAPVEADFLFA